MATSIPTQPPKVSIQKKDKAPTEPIAKPMTLEEARQLDKSSAGAKALEPKVVNHPTPRKDYTQVPTPPADMGIASNAEPTRIIIDFNRFGQIAEVTFMGQSALLATSGRMRSFVGTIIHKGEIARSRQRSERIVANEKARLAELAKPEQKKK